MRMYYVPQTALKVLRVEASSGFLLQYFSPFIQEFSCADEEKKEERKGLAWKVSLDRLSARVCLLVCLLLLVVSQSVDRSIKSILDKLINKAASSTTSLTSPCIFVALSDEYQRLAASTTPALTDVPHSS